MRVRILGAAAGGGLPQWNCRCPNCEAARAGCPDVVPRTQSSVAVSADGRSWFLLNVSPDIRQQILAFPELGPPEGPLRGSAIAGCILTDAELDHTTGLLLLREGPGLQVFSTTTVRHWANAIFPLEPILKAFHRGRWSALPFDEFMDLNRPDGSASGLRLKAFRLGRHVPRFVLRKNDPADGSVIGLLLHDERSGERLVYAPCVEAVNAELADAARDAACLLMDGTFWSDDELVRLGVSDRTARDMGHLPVSGPAGSLAWLAAQPARTRAYVHINNTNPMLDCRRPEHRQVVEQGVHICADGDEFIV